MIEKEFSSKIIDFEKGKEKIKAIQQRKWIEDCTDKFIEHLPELVERKRQEAARVGESYPTLEQIIESAATEDYSEEKQNRDTGAVKKFTNLPIAIEFSKM